MKNLEIKLNGDIENIDVRALSEALTATDKILKSIQINSFDEHSNSDVVTFQNIRTSSILTTVRYDDAVIDALETGITQLKETGARPKYWTDETLTNLQSLEKAGRRVGVDSVQIGVNKKRYIVDAALSALAGKAISSGIKSLGSVSGILHRYVSKPKTEASLTNEQTNKSVVLKLDESLRDQVKILLDKRVTVWGVLTRGLLDNQVIGVDVKGIEKAEIPSIRPPVHEGKGILGPDWLDGKDPVDWVRSMRDRAQ